MLYYFHPENLEPDVWVPAISSNQTQEQERERLRSKRSKGSAIICPFTLEIKTPGGIR